MDLTQQQDVYRILGRDRSMEVLPQDLIDGVNEFALARSRINPQERISAEDLACFISARFPKLLVHQKITVKMDGQNREVTTLWLPEDQKAANEKEGRKMVRTEGGTFASVSLSSIVRKRKAAQQDEAGSSG